MYNMGMGYLVVTTTLKPEWQLLAEKSVNDIMDKEGAEHDASQAALLAMMPISIHAIKFCTSPSNLHEFSAEVTAL